MKSVVVTGVSSGIGRQIARDLIAQGYRVFGSVRKAADGEDVTAELGAQFTPLIFDVTDRAAVDAAAAKVDAELKGEKLAGLVNNAGIAVIGPIQNLSPEQFQTQFDVNLMGVFHATQAFLDLLGADTSRTGEAGKIINISSVSGAIGMPFMGAYNMSKFGLEGLSEALRRELIMFDIDVVVVAPGPVKTPIWEKFDNAALIKSLGNSAFCQAFGPHARLYPSHGGERL
jgi:NAD(P)-dependent dehydrogenase (short-subunit alcohol dehydrogenase family)